MPVFFNNNLLEGSESINNISKKIKLYSLKNIKNNNSKIILSNNNSVQFLNKEGELIYSCNISPHLENLEILVKSLQNGEYTFNTDPYEQLLPIKYSLIKNNGEIFLHSIEHCQFI